MGKGKGKSQSKSQRQLQSQSKNKVNPQNPSPPATTLRRSTRSKPTTNSKGDVDFTVEMQDLATSNKTLIQTNTKFKNTKHKLLVEHEELTMTKNELNIAILSLTENNALINENNVSLYEKYSENMLGCNKDLKNCITQFKKQQKLVIENIENEKMIYIGFIGKIQNIKVKIDSVKSKLQRLYPQGGAKSRDPREELQKSNTNLTIENTELKESITTLKATITTLKTTIAKLEVEKKELEERQKTIQDANTDFDSFIQLVNNIQLLEKEYYNIKSKNDKLDEIWNQLNREKKN